MSGCTRCDQWPLNDLCGCRGIPNHKTLKITCNKATWDGKVARTIHGPLERSDKMWPSIYAFLARNMDWQARILLASLNLSDEFDGFDGWWKRHQYLSFLWFTLFPPFKIAPFTLSLSVVCTDILSTQFWQMRTTENVNIAISPPKIS